MKVLVLAIVLVSALAKPTPIPYKDCAPTKRHLKVDEVVADPWPPVKGQNFEIQARGTLDEEITAGTFSADVYYLGMKIYSTTGKLCEQSGVKCPIEPGPYNVTKDVTFPSEAPAGPYTIQAYAKDQKGEYLTCAIFDVKVKLSSAQLWGMAVADDDHWSEVAHDFLKGFFQGLNRDGKDLIDHLKDPTQYLQRDDLFNFLMAIKAIKENPKDISRYVTAFTASGKLLGSLHDAVLAVGDVKNSDKLKALIADFKNISQLKNLVLPMLVDPLFHQDIRELVSVFGCVRSGDCAWSDLGLKFGELFHTIISHA